HRFGPPGASARVHTARPCARLLPGREAASMGVRPQRFSEVWIADSDGKNPFRLTSFNALYLDNPRWSPDGQRIAFRANDDIHAIDVNSRRSQRLTNNSALDNAPFWSPDGRSIYFQRRGTIPQIWAVAVDRPSDPRQVTRHGGDAPHVSPDGKTLYYMKLPHELWSMPVDGGEEKRILTDLSNTSNYVIRDEG